MSMDIAASPSIPIEEIDRQRSLGWRDIHPEDYCHRCGCRNIECWFTDKETWAEATLIGSQWSHIICPACFTKLHEESTGNRQIWEIRNWIVPNKAKP